MGKIKGSKPLYQTIIDMTKFASHDDPRFADIQDLGDLNKHTVKEIAHFFATYKQLEGVTIETLGWATAEDAIAEVKSSVERFATKS